MAVDRHNQAMDDIVEVATDCAKSRHRGTQDNLFPGYCSNERGNVLVFSDLLHATTTFEHAIAMVDIGEMFSKGLLSHQQQIQFLYCIGSYLKKMKDHILRRFQTVQFSDPECTAHANQFGRNI
ncbi:hypothetical protein PR048_013755 [Dryococelus australis]|uniref:Uncharacterized protein n=1 Tax=Dryococelus australis TaxID=614101 RepID=A0ABQ9HT35_9NEOP|nr:hypothetical protein PR048_013755 [Dryococelus australis]